MSTKIYNGVRIEMPAVEAMDVRAPWWQRLVKGMEAYRHKAMARVVASMLAHGIDTGTITPDASAGSRAVELFFDRWLKQHRSKERLDPEIDFAASIAWFPRDNGGPTMAMLFGEGHVVVQMRRLAPVLVDYPYWNNTDQPGDVSAEAWAARGREWAEVMPTGIPATDGLTRDVYSAQVPMLMSRAPVMRYIPTPAERAQTRAKALVMDEMYTALLSKVSSSDPDPSLGYRLVLEVQRDPTYVTRVVERAAEIKPGLIEITREMVTGKP
jgi:hypothetical protein